MLIKLSLLQVFFLQKLYKIPNCVTHPTWLKMCKKFRFSFYSSSFVIINQVLLQIYSTWWVKQIKSNIFYHNFHFAVCVCVRAFVVCVFAITENVYGAINNRRSI